MAVPTDQAEDEPGGVGRRAAFLKEWLKAPRQLGAVAPSGASLARAMTEGVSEATGPVIELGPGTGVLTRAILARGVPRENLAAIEFNGEFAVTLARRFTGVRVIQGDAARLRRLSPFGAQGAGIVICGLPLLSIPPRSVYRILAGCRDSLRPGGEMRLFTYGPVCPVPGEMLARLGLVARRGAFVARNIPPAWVFVVTRGGTGEG